MKLSYTKVSRGIKGATDKSSIWDRRKIITWEGSELNENFIKSHSASQVIKNCPAWKLTASLRGKKSYYSLPSSSEILNTSYSMEFCFVCVWKYMSSLLIRPTQYIICKRVLGTQNVYCLCTLGFGEREGEIASICHEVIGLDVMILVFWILRLKPPFSLSSLTFGLPLWLSW